MSAAAVPPISYVIDRQAGVIIETWRGDVSIGDLRQYWQGYLADPEVMALRKTLVDLRASNILFIGTQLSDLISVVVVPKLKGRTWKSALLVERPLQFGVSRQYHVFAEQYSSDSIFHDFDKALAWLQA
jgi:hypothetical protein